MDDPSLGLVNFEPFIQEIADVPGAAPASVLTRARGYPNPFNPRVEIALALSRPAHVSLTVVDLAGRLLRELHAGDLEAGDHAFTWDGTTSPAAASRARTYFYRVVAGGESRVGKLVLVR